MATDLEKLLDRAKRALEKNKPADAVEAFQAVLQAAPGNIEALQALGDLHTRGGDAGKAAVYYGQLFDRLTEPREEPKAAALYTRFLRLSEQPPERQARYAHLLQRQNKTGEAIENYSVAAEHFIARGKEDDALKCLEQIAELDPEKPERHLAMAQLAESRGRNNIAARGYVRAGQLALSKGEMPRAMELLGNASGAAPEDRDVALLYAQALLMAGDPAQAVAKLSPFAQTESSAVFRKCFGEALMRSGELDRAREELINYYGKAGGDRAMLFELAEAFIAAGEDAKGVEVLASIRLNYRDSSSATVFAGRLDRIAEANPHSLAFMEFWSDVYSGLNREAKYFETLVRLFDCYQENGNLKRACDVLDRMVDIDPYDFRNQQRLEKLRDTADKDYVSRVASRLGVTMAQVGVAGSSFGEGMDPADSAGSAGATALDDLLVQAEIFVQYALMPKAIERLQKIAELFPSDAEDNERFRNLCELASWWPEGMSKKAPARPAESATEGHTAAASPAATPPAPTGVYSQETMRDLSKISEVGQGIYKQASPRAMLTFTVGEIGKHLRASRCLAVIGAPGQPPQLAAEYCAPGVAPASGNQVMRLIAQMERAAPDSMGGLPLEAAAAPVLKEVGLATALAVALMDKDTQTPAGMIITGHAEAYSWKPNETYFLQAVGDQMLLSVSHTRLRSLVKTLAVPDEKTGLLARSAYTDRLMSEALRAKSHGSLLSLAILHLDHGPELMRQHGESLLEKTLEQISRAALPIARPSDLPVKYNAWSLAFILPETSVAGALGLIEQMRQAVAAARNGGSENHALGAITLSAGVVEAIARADYDTEDIVTDMMNRAEASLEEARKRGGDSVISLANPKI
ncbi:MAG TPA: tetratricopeptide repeat protein [Candidatus Acidoferrum sp.]|nr:tetratricopeptide repeat protein [Candidatus Acidoferrum sp.]